MPRHTTQHFNSQAASENKSRGCLWFTGLTFGVALPPLTVLILGLLMTVVLGQIDITALAADGSLNTAMYSGKIAPLFTPEVQRWGDEIAAWSEHYGLDPNLAATVMQIESCGDTRALSYAGAMGLFQVMPYHFSLGEDTYDPETNAFRGLAHLKNALDTRGGDERLALAGYNGGIMGTMRPEYFWPAETIRYVYWGTGIYADAKQGKAQSERLNEWLGRGGASLCAQAAGR
ncbi:MAG: transglycosylase SLT domain-containing protein [Chloroflexi bacterium]|jgi:hypothetical protein|nr:transglycosylase SLT domain-containing protein [Chloroflexota bacterium]